MPRDMRNYLDYDYIHERLTEAGTVMMMLPGRVRPDAYKSNWPSHLREWLDTIEVVYEPDENGVVRASINIIRPEPDKPIIRANLQQITRMEEVIYNWQPRLAAQCIAMRTPWVAHCLKLAILHDPITGRRIWPWARLAKHFDQRSRQTPANWYKDGVHILEKILNK